MKTVIFDWIPENERDGYLGVSLLILRLHPGRLTWTMIMEVWKIIFLSKWVICKFHVNLAGCTNLPLGRFHSASYPAWHLVISQVGTLTHMSPEVLDRKCPRTVEQPGDAKQESGWWLGGWFFETWGKQTHFLWGYGVYVKEPGWFLFVGFVFVVFCLRCWEILYVYCYPCCVCCGFCWEDIRSVSLTFSHYHEHLYVWQTYLAVVLQ